MLAMSGKSHGEPRIADSSEEYCKKRSNDIPALFGDRSIIRKRSVAKKLRQTWAALASSQHKTPAHTNHAVQRYVHDRTAVEAVRDQRSPRLTQRTRRRPISVRVGQLFYVLLD